MSSCWLEAESVAGQRRSQHPSPDRRLGLGCRTDTKRGRSRFEPGDREERIHVVGLTGGIACGKSTVAVELRRRGYPVIDADQLARLVVEPGEPALAEITRELGPEALRPDGRLDRRAVGRRVFGNPELRRKLEAITHPIIRERSRKELSRLAADGHGMAFYEAPLLVEGGIHTDMDALVVVSAKPATQLARLLARDHDLTESDARARIAAQMPVAEKEALADWVIHNDGSPTELAGRIDEMLQRLAEKLSG